MYSTLKTPAHQRSQTYGVANLREWFKNEPIFTEVIDAILELDRGVNLQQRKCARHRASEYMIKDRRLWRVVSGHSTRARSRMECVTREEATQLAKLEHESKGHWQQDSVKSPYSTAFGVWASMHP